MTIIPQAGEAFRVYASSSGTAFDVTNGDTTYDDSKFHTTLASVDQEKECAYESIIAGLVTQKKNEPVSGATHCLAFRSLM